MNVMTFWHTAVTSIKATAIAVAYFGFISAAAYIMAINHLK